MQACGPAAAARARPVPAASSRRAGPPAHLQQHEQRRAAARGRCTSTRARAALPWLQQLQQLQQLWSPVQPAPYLSPELAAAQRELLALLQQPDARSGGPERQRAHELVQQLAESRLPFEEQRLGGGPWVVRYTSGAPQLWKATWGAGRLVRARNAASQELRPGDGGRALVSRAEYWGGACYVTASGTYAPQGPAQTTPVEVVADVTSGELVVGTWRLRLPIAGRGRFLVLFCDGELRVFQSAGARVVQVRADLLQAEQEA